jgi:hypothetical protein
MWFVPSQGSAYGRLRRAVDTGNATIALAAAADLEHVGLDDALELLPLLLDSERSRFERAALRWHGRYCREVSDVDLLRLRPSLPALLGCGMGGPARPPMRLPTWFTAVTSPRPARRLTGGAQGVPKGPCRRRVGGGVPHLAGTRAGEF